ncbi:MAG TPA: GNAT family N-acetyltransferase [Hanamia sp.]
MIPEKPLMNNDFEILQWDSDFFNFKVAKIKNDVLLKGDFFEKLYKENVQLAYYSSKTKLTETSNEYYNLNLVDEKITFLKEIEISSLMSKTESYLEKYPGKKLIELAIESGIYSRFNVDPKIGRKKFEELYTQWIIKSVSKEIADDVLVYKIDDQIAGFVTVGQKNGRADIGIIAVDKSNRGKGIGKTLMKAAENFYFNKLKLIQVVTQGDNLPAIKLYTSCGYKQETTEYFYHLWKKAITQ